MSIIVSVVICAYNSATRLPATLSHLSAQQGIAPSEWEILLIDNASNDGTQAVFNSFSEKHRELRWRIVYEAKPGTAYARQRGVLESEGEIVLFVDDDNWLEPGYVAGVKATLSQLSSAGGVGGVSQVVSDAPVPTWFPRYCEWYAVNSESPHAIALEEKQTLWTAGAAFRREMLLQFVAAEKFLDGRVGASLAAGEDIELSLYFQLRGWKLYRSQDLRFQHYMAPARLDWTYLERLHYASGLTSARLDVYRLYWLNGKTATLQGWLRRHWIVQFLYTSAQVAFNSAWIPWVRTSQDNRLSWLLYRGRLEGLWRDRNAYNARMRSRPQIRGNATL
jgi:glycosyltransferase involved in cell wall biosynthesis